LRLIGVSDMRDALVGFWREQAGQDTVEYTLLLAFVVVVSAAMFMLNGDSIAGIWCGTNSNLSAASSMAS
jgi:Flp pilus assembly pilin Flp